MNDKITVSVIIPTYKRTVNYLSRAVDSVLNQTYSQIEVVVIDDSPDSYPERKDIAHYMFDVQKKNSRVIYFQNKKNIGGSLSRNRGIEACHGQYVTFLDDDDEYKPRKVEEQLRFMLQQDCDMSFSNMILYDSEGKVVDFRNHTDIKSFDNDALLRYHLTKKITGTPTFMYKTEKLRDIGGFDDAILGQEFYLMLKTIKSGLKIRYMDDCNVIVYKHSDGGISQGKNKIIGENLVFKTIQESFDMLSPRERRFATFRHWAVMVVAYKRNGMYGQLLMAAMKAFFSSPVDFVTEVIRFRRKTTQGCC